jgi:pimeloyl-ACP methyl ester carboxylesterase
MSASAARGRRSSCCMASATPAICGRRWRPRWRRITVIVPDLRGVGLSAHPDTGYTKKNQAVDIAGVLDYLKIEKADLVTHDIGNMVGFAFAAQYPSRVTRWVAMDAPLPSIGDWDNIIRDPHLWHFNFRGPDVERLVKRPRAHRSRPLLQRTLRQSLRHRRDNARSLRGALCAAPGHV